jgi:hypothetical protein
MKRILTLAILVAFGAIAGLRSDSFLSGPEAVSAPRESEPVKPIPLQVPLDSNQFVKALRATDLSRLALYTLCAPLVLETVKVIDLVEHALLMNSRALARHDVEAIREFANVPPVAVEKHKLLQILVNLIRNPKFACDEADRPDKPADSARGRGRVHSEGRDHGATFTVELPLQASNKMAA